MERRLIFTKEVKSSNHFSLEPCQLDYPLDIPDIRKESLDIPEVSEIEVVRHYTKLSKLAHGVDDGFYPLGSCTMKYNPKISEELAALAGFAQIHPLQPSDTVTGCLKIIEELKESLCKVTGMADFSLAPAAGAHGEFAGLLMVRKYHESRQDTKRTIVLVPDSAHGTNPASANMCGYQVVTVPSDKKGTVDLAALKDLLSDQVACLMLTNPNTLGLFESEIAEIAKSVHQAGGLLYYDGANLNAIMGIARPKEMGFDIVHLNLHKTFGTPHGGGGPGSGPVGCVEELSEFLPNNDSENSVGKIKAFHGNFLVLVKALCYIKLLGLEGLAEVSKHATLNANYLMHQLHEDFDIPFYDQGCMHEFVISLQNHKEEREITALDIAKALIDHDIHPPTVYFPLIVKEALMVEPTETENRETMDDFVRIMKDILKDENIKSRPLTTPITRVDEVKAAREPILRYRKKDT